MDDEGRYTIDELVDLTGLARRTIRFYVERGLLAPPAGRGRGGFYGEAQLARLREIVAAREEGLSLDAIQRRPPAPVVEPVTATPEALPPGRRTLRWELAPGMSLIVDESGLAGREGLLRELLAAAGRWQGAEDRLR